MGKYRLNWDRGTRAGGTSAEVEAAFERYEAALNANDVAVLDASFWASPHTVRYGLGENLYGRDEILAFRKGRPAVDLRRKVA